MNEVSLKPVIEELENLFSKFNAQFFADKDNNMMVDDLKAKLIAENPGHEVTFKVL